MAKNIEKMTARAIQKELLENSRTIKSIVKIAFLLLCIFTGWALGALDVIITKLG